MQMILIDLAGLASAPINPTTLVHAYGLSGYLLPPERRLAVLMRLRQDPMPHLVYTGPTGAEFWRDAPAHIQVRVLPGSEEVGRRLKVPANDFTDVNPDTLQGLRQVGEVSGTTQTAPYQFQIVDSALALAQFSQLLAEAVEAHVTIGLDTETTSEDDRVAELVGLGVSISKELNFYLPVRSDAGVYALGVVRDLLPKMSYIAHNAKYDYKILKRHGFPIEQAKLVGDGMIAAYVLAGVDKQGQPLPKRLKWLAEAHLGIHQPEFADMMAAAGVDNVWNIPWDTIGQYCAGDAFLGIQIEHLLADMLVDMGLDKIYRQLELPNVTLLAEMELLGLPIDLPAAKERRIEYTLLKSSYQQVIQQLATEAGWSKTTSKAHHGQKRSLIKDCSECDDKGRIQVPVPFNPNSRHHVGELLQGTLKLPLLRATSDGPSNDRLTLLQLEQMAPDENTKTILGALLRERKASKILGTYLIPIVEGAKKTSHFGATIDTIHPRYNQTVVESGRLSSEGPNAQNQPLPLRDLYKAPPGYLFWDADYGQLELRIMAAVSHCTAMIEAFLKGEDIHALTGWRVFGVRPADLTPTMRVRCKALNFGVGYGAEKYTIHEQILKAALEYPELHIIVPSIQECQNLIREYWKAYPEVREFRELIYSLLAERGYSETIYGRRRQLPLIHSPVDEFRKRAQRQGWNLVIQGTAGDIMKNAELMVGAAAATYDADLRCQVHDELLGLVKYGRAEEWLQKVSKLMVLDQPLSPVPLVVSAHVGPTWAEAK